MIERIFHLCIEWMIIEKGQDKKNNWNEDLKTGLQENALKLCTYKKFSDHWKSNIACDTSSGLVNVSIEKLHEPNVRKTFYFIPCEKIWFWIQYFPNGRKIEIKSKYDDRIQLTES